MLYTFCSFSTFALLVMQKCSQTEVSKPSGILLVLSKSSMAFINWSKASLFNFPDPGRSPKGTRLVVSACILCLWILVLSIKAHQRFIFSHTKQSLLNNITFSRGVTLHGTSLWLVGGLLQREKHLLGPFDISGILRHDRKWTTDVPQLQSALEALTAQENVSLLGILSRQVNAWEKCGCSLVPAHASSADAFLQVDSLEYVQLCAHLEKCLFFIYIMDWFCFQGCSWEGKGTEICASTHPQGASQCAVKLL